MHYIIFIIFLFMFLLYFDENKILYFSNCNFLNNVYRKFFIKNIQISNNKGK